MLWDNTTIDYARKLKKTGINWEMVADCLNSDYNFSPPITGNAVRKAVARHYRDNQVSIPDTISPELSPRLDIPYRDTLVLFDIHAGYHDNAFITQMVRLAQLAGIEHLVTDSDLFDFASISKYPKTTREINLEEDLEVAGKMLYYLGQHFSMSMINANHGMRLSKKLDQFIDLSRIVAMALNGRDATVTTTNREYMTMGDFYFGHPSDMRGGSVTGKIPYLLAMKYNKNVLTGHTHQSGYLYTTNGKLALEVGCCINGDLVGYKQTACNAMRDFALGAALIIDGEVFHFDKSGNTTLNSNVKRSFSYWEKYFRKGK